jgi:hypothetical protein
MYDGPLLLDADLVLFLFNLFISFFLDHSLAVSSSNHTQELRSLPIRRKATVRVLLSQFHAAVCFSPCPSSFYIHFSCFLLFISFYIFSCFLLFFSFSITFLAFSYFFFILFSFSISFFLSSVLNIVDCCDLLHI